MQTFDFPYHTVSDEYPESSLTVRFGRGYAFATKPKGPDQIITRLNFPIMFVMKSLETNLIDAAAAPQLNIEKLIDFYEAHGTYEPFLYTHPRRGSTEWRFNKPIVTPKPLGPDKIAGIAGWPNHAAHAVESFQLEFILLP